MSRGKSRKTSRSRRTEATDTAARLAEGVACHQLGQLEKAEAIYRQVLEAEPDNPGALHYLGVVRLQSRRFDDAASLIERSVAVNPDDANSLNDLGQAYESLGRPNDAAGAYRRALAVDPGSAAAHSNLGNVLGGQGETAEAITCYRRALETEPNDTEVLSNLGGALSAAGEAAEAIMHLSRAHEIAPGEPVILFNLGNAHKENGSLGEAAGCYERALVIDPSNPEFLCNLGSALLADGDPDGAASAFERALAADPAFVEGYYNLGLACQELGRVEEAVASYRKALAIKPDYAGAHNNLGMSLKKLGKLDEAVASYRKALATQPNFAEAHYNLGNAFGELGRLDEAVVSYHEALTIQPDYAEAHENLGKLCMDMGRYGEAKAAYDQVLRLNHGGPWWNAATFADGDRAGRAPLAEAPPTSSFKLRDAADQLEYLIGKGRIDPSFERMVEHYRAVLIEREEHQGHDDDFTLTPNQTERLSSFYNRVVHYADAPHIDTGVVNRSLDFERIEDSYLAAPVSVTTIDDFLTPEALRALRNFCLESTIYFTGSGDRFVTSRVHYGFNCDILYQMAEELKKHLPGVLGGHALSTMWIYRYDNQSEGVAVHTDAAAVTFNFWITPDDANQMPDCGGLIVYAKEQPYDWDWMRYNAEKNTPAVKQEIAVFLADAETVTIPYRDNRAVLFHSNLFHKSDRVHFKDGFGNRRMNVTMLFGKRET